MKKVFFLVLTLLILSAASVNAQVRIGGNADPNTSAILDLNATDTTTVGKLGLALPRVNLASTTAQLNGANPLNGTMVYNTNASMTNGQGAGVYFWNGGKWNALAPVVPVTDLTVTGDTVVGRNEDLQLDVTVAPVTASNQRVAWTSSNTNIASVDQHGLVRGKTVGSVTITATAQDGSGKTGTKKVNVYTGAGTTAIAGRSYSVYTYPDTIGTWMTANLNVASADTVVAGTAYYLWSTASTVCPSGWALPTMDNAIQLGAFVNATNRSSDSWTHPGVLAGFFYPTAIQFYGTEARYWLRESNTSLLITPIGIGMANPTNPLVKMTTVRCRKNN